MTTTSLSLTTRDAPAEIERYLRRLCTMPEAWSLEVKHYVGDVRAVVTTPAGVPLPPDAGPSPDALEIVRLVDELGARDDAITALQVELEAAADRHAAELRSKDEQIAALADRVAALQRPPA